MATKPSVILGVSYGHGDSSAALIVEGVLVAASEEERFTRIKHCAAFPDSAIQYCLKHAGLTASQVEVVAIAKRPMNQWKRRLNFVLQHPHLFRKRRIPGSDPLVNEAKSLKISGLSHARIHRVEHHLAHLLSARVLSPKDELALLSFDGLGDFTSTVVAKSKGNSVEILDRVLFPHSLGFFYTALTQYLGFPHFGDEFKVMGLSSLGEPKYLDVMRTLIREKESFGFELNLEAFPLHKRPIEMFNQNHQPKVLPFYSSSFLTHVIGFPARKPKEILGQVHWDLAKSVQVRFEEIANHLLKQLHSLVPSNTLALAGGCAHNSVWVGKIPQNSPFKKVFVAPACHDAGIAVGAAVAAADREVSPQGGHWALLGPSVEESPSPKNETNQMEAITFKNDKKLMQWLADEIALGKIIGFMHGRMEFGPRALGNRSILCDPRQVSMKDKLNARVKHRESFRPFAASVLEEYQKEWFKNHFYSPTMEAVFEVWEDRRAQIPAVVHCDNTCRIQSVNRETQPFFWDLIDTYRKKTGVPMLLNTSFNDCEPIVCTKEDAIRCFLNCEMDYLVIENEVYAKKTASIPMQLTA